MKRLESRAMLGDRTACLYSASKNTGGGHPGPDSMIVLIGICNMMALDSLVFEPAYFHLRFAAFASLDYGEPFVK